MVASSLPYPPEGADAVVNVSARSVLPPELDPRGPRVPKRRGRPPALRMINVIAIATSVIILIVSVGGYVVEQWFNGSIARVHLNLGKNRPAGAPTGSENWLLVGTDNSAPGEYGDRAGERSDTTILTHLDADGTTTNVSFPRDTLVTIPAYTDSSGVAHPSRKDKFNTAISLGGPSLLVRTVEQMTGIRVDHYVSVNLDGFKKISDAINGVSICILPSTYKETGPDGGTITNINDGFSGFHGKVGVQTLVGDQALAFVRQRHGLVNGDIGRIQRQQQFLGSVFRTATSNRFLFNPDAVLRLLSAIKSALTLDQDTSLTDLEKLGLRLRGLDPGKVTFETIPQRGLEYTDTNLGQVINFGNGPELIPNGQTKSVGNVQVLDQAGFETMIAKLKDEKPPATPKASATAKPKTVKLTVPPAKVLVTVENGTGRTGLAGQVTQLLAQGGFRTGSAANSGTNRQVTTEVHYSPGNEDAARTAAAAVPGAVLKADPSVSDGVVLLLGANYTSVAPVDMSGAVAANPAPTPTAAPTSAAPVITAASAGNRCTY
ncbi:MAG TPA: LCP family protein [Frankiaceae bacterium]|nr:LCP family protein [Frankiaceae bacterium]